MVHHVGPGAPSLAQPGRYEGRRQGTLPSTAPISQAAAIRRHSTRALPSSSLRYTAADRGDPA